jgi:hypothetical protein
VTDTILFPIDPGFPRRVLHSPLKFLPGLYRAKLICGSRVGIYPARMKKIERFLRRTKRTRIWLRSRPDMIRDALEVVGISILGLAALAAIVMATAPGVL